MRIVYLCSFNAIREAGPYRKIREHCQTWSKLGHDVRLVATISGDKRLPQHKSDCFETVDFCANSFIKKVLSTKQIERSVREFAPDLLYLRYQTVSPFVLRCSKIAPLVVELNGLTRQNNVKQKLAYQLSKAWYKRHSAGFVVVTNEMIDLCKDIIADRPSAVVRNGVSLDAMHLAKTKSSGKSAVFVGNGVPWHGLDRLRMIAEYLPDWRFHLVCPRRQSWDLPNVSEYGFLPKSKYQQLLIDSTIGFGPLALERSGLSEASALKIGEYLMHGLPFVVNYKETDMPVDSDFVFQIDDNQLGELQLKSMKRFMEYWSTHTFDPTPYFHTVDLNVLEKKRLKFFQGLVG